MPSARVLLRHPTLVAGLLFCALLLRMAVPAGYMPVVSGGWISLELCPGTMPASDSPSVAGMHHGSGKHDAPVKAEQPCVFAGLAAPALGAADPLLVLAALLFTFVLALHGGALRRPPPPARLRPPMRAPPLPS